MITKSPVMRCSVCHTPAIVEWRRVSRNRAHVITYRCRVCKRCLRERPRATNGDAKKAGA
jgi:protein-arginine kinase activator protein McsA